MELLQDLVLELSPRSRIDLELLAFFGPKAAGGEKLKWTGGEILQRAD